jgi:hypothetical protein
MLPLAASPLAKIKKGRIEESMNPAVTHFATITGRVLAFLIGCTPFYLVFFLYEDEEGKWGIDISTKDVSGPIPQN